MTTRAASALYLLLALVLTLPAWAPLARPGLPPTQAGPLPVLRLYAVERGAAPTIGQTPDRWRSDGPWTYWIARGPRLLGATGETAVKVSAWLALMIIVVGCYLWGGRMATARGSVLAALLALYTPVLLGSIYQTGDLAALWVLAGLVVAGWGVVRSGWRGPLVAAAGASMAAASLPGMGLAAALGLAILSIGMRRWRSAGALFVGVLLGLILTVPWSRPMAMFPASEAPQLYQLVEPSWYWETQTLTGNEPISFSLGLPLLGLLVVAIWSYPRPEKARTPNTQPDQAHAAQTRRTWLLATALGLSFVALSLLASVPRFSLLSSLVIPRHLLLLSIPFLAVAAASAVYHVSELRHAPVWAALVMLPLLSAGAALSPAFVTPAIPPAPTAIFGENQVMLLDLTADGELQPGETITLHAAWVALQPPDFDYNIFVHLDDASGATLTQLDVQPQQGVRPLTSWRPGEVITDTYKIAIPANAPTDLHLRLGLYNWQTLVRLRAGDADADAVQWQP